MSRLYPLLTSVELQYIAIRKINYFFSILIYNGKGVVVTGNDLENKTNYEIVTQTKAVFPFPCSFQGWNSMTSIFQYITENLYLYISPSGRLFYCRRTAFWNKLYNKALGIQFFNDLWKACLYLVGWQATWNFDFNNAVKKMDFFLRIFSFGPWRFKKAKLYYYQFSFN